ncbi:hypothetical protein ABZ816_39085 [Actinosynnema sp. NPDC047251]
MATMITAATVAIIRAGIGSSGTLVAGGEFRDAESGDADTGEAGADTPDVPVRGVAAGKCSVTPESMTSAGQYKTGAEPATPECQLTV